MQFAKVHASVKTLLWTHVDGEIRDTRDSESGLVSATVQRRKTFMDHEKLNI